MASASPFSNTVRRRRKPGGQCHYLNVSQGAESFRRLGQGRHADHEKLRAGIGVDRVVIPEDPAANPALFRCRTRFCRWAMFWW
ncbi:MAG: hypothetical protein JXR80_03035 [Deltaproteobacteria bacterium]|nr:hypothetical protein [Deltaproteobacteria bacterium]